MKFIQSNDKYANEVELLVLSARCELKENEILRFEELLQCQLDWGYILINVLHNRIACMLFSHIVENHFVSYIQDRIYLILRSYYSYFKRRQILGRQELNVLVSKLNERNIDYALLKGFALCDRAYPDEKKYYRECGDFDILVKRTDIELLKTIIVEENYSLGDFDIYTGDLKKISRHEALFFKMYSHQMHEYNKAYLEDELIDNRGAFTIDINLSILEGGKDDIDVSILLAETEQRKDCAYKALMPEWFFIQICVHLYRDIESKIHKAKYENVTLAKFCDVNEYVKHNFETVDWNKVYYLCTEHGLFDEVCKEMIFLYKLYHTEEINSILKIWDKTCDETLSEYDKVLFYAMFSEKYNRSSYTENVFEFYDNDGKR